VHERSEVTAAGFDDFRQLVATGSVTDPLAGPDATGIRIPPAAVPAAYRILLCVLDLDIGDTLIGIRQGMEIGGIVSSSDDSGTPLPPLYPEIRPVETFGWHFIDGAWVWTLTSEPLAPPYRRTGPFDQDSFNFEDAGASALVYATAHFPAVPLLPGYLGLDAYTPPGMRGKKIVTARDIRWPFDEDQSNAELWIPVRRPTRFRLYCDVKQTDPEIRNAPTIGTSTDVRQVEGLVPEEEFLQFLAPLANVSMQPVAWRAHGRLIYDRRRKAP
jgi:hypothetical protein